MDPREQLRRARFVAQGLAAGVLAVVVSAVVAGAGQAVALATGGGGLAWQLTGFGLPALALLGVVWGQARLARSQADRGTYGYFAGAAALVLAVFPALLLYLLAAGSPVDGETVASLLGVPLLGGLVLWREA